MSMEFPDIEFYYPLERISLISSKLGEYKVELLNNFLEFYEALEIKVPDVNSFRRNNRNQRNFKNGWRRKNRYKVKDIEKFLVNSYKRQLPDNDDEKIRRLIISHLNKLNAKKFTIIVKEFIDTLEEQKFSETYDLLNREIMEKVMSDSHYGFLYARLVRELIINKKWQKMMLNIIENESGQFYWSLNVLDDANSEFVGPFTSREEALEDGMSNHSYKSIFCNFLEDEFKGRRKFLEEIERTVDEFDINLYAKSKYNNFLKFILSCVEIKIFNVNVLHHVLLQLINNGELEQFVYLFEVMQNSKLKVKNPNVLFYQEEINKNLKTTSISPKTKYKLLEFFSLDIVNANPFDALAVATSSQENTDDIVNEDRSDEDREIGCIISEYPLTHDYGEVKRQFEKIKDYVSFYNRLIENILEGKNEDILVDMVKKLWEDNSEFANSFVGYIEEHLIELYSEYKIDYPNCTNLFITMIRNNIGIVGNEFIEKLVGKTSEDEDESYNIDLFNRNIMEQLKH